MQSFISNPSRAVELIADSQLGIFAPGVRTIGKYFRNMWAAAEADPDKYGCESHFLFLGMKVHATNTDI